MYATQSPFSNYFFYVVPLNQTFSQTPQMVYTMNPCSLQLPFGMVNQEGISIQPEEPPNKSISVDTKEGNKASHVQVSGEFRPPKKSNKPQNPFRNTYTNLGNQVLGFVSTRKKSNDTLLQLFPSLAEEQIRAYYHYALRMRRTLNGYMNLKKMEKLWSTVPVEEDEGSHSLFIRFCYYYLTELSVLVLLTSRKLQKDILKEHLASRRRLISILRRIQSNNRDSFNE